ncbi:MAG TPA: hypothetical protein VK979_04315 [Guyparkeria sp.]|nr:hypothetical protein [Guyparkeria sp.]
MIYEWKNGSRIGIDPAKAGPVLSKLAKDGECDPRAVIREAKKKSSPLHEYFEWDDTKAADLYRTGQAQHLIRCLVIRNNEKDESSRQAFYGIHFPKETRYYEPHTILSDAELSELLMAQAKKDMERFVDKYEEIRSLLEPAYTHIKQIVNG